MGDFNIDHNVRPTTSKSLNEYRVGVAVSYAGTLREQNVVHPQHTAVRLPWAPFALVLSRVVFCEIRDLMC